MFKGILGVTLVLFLAQVSICDVPNAERINDAELIRFYGGWRILDKTIKGHDRFGELITSLWLSDKRSSRGYECELRSLRSVHGISGSADLHYKLAPQDKKIFIVGPSVLVEGSYELEDDDLKIVYVSRENRIGGNEAKCTLHFRRIAKDDPERPPQLKR